MSPTTRQIVSTKNNNPRKNNFTEKSPVTVNQRSNMVKPKKQDSTYQPNHSRKPSNQFKDRKQNQVQNNNKDNNEISFSDLKKNYSGYSINELNNEIKAIDSQIDNGNYIAMANENILTQEQRKYLGLLLQKRDAMNIVKMHKQIEKIED